VRVPILAFLGLMLPSTSSRAASFLSKYEYHSFWSDVFPILVMAGLGICFTIYFLRKIRRQAATAQKDTLRNDRELLLHYLSLLFVSLPILYTFFFDIDLFWAQFWIITVQVAIMLVLRFFKVKLVFRLLCLVPSCLLSIIVGEIILIWPHTELSLIETSMHMTLGLYGLSFSVGSILSYISFPAAYRARAW
jgi:hypothetical protein